MVLALNVQNKTYKVILFIFRTFRFDDPDSKLFILVGWDRCFVVCCLAHWGLTCASLLLQISSGVV